MNGRLTPVTFDAAFAQAPLVVASLASCNGADTASPRIADVTGTGFKAMALEDQSYDLETFHGYEIVDWLAFSNEGTIYAGGDAPAPSMRIAEGGFAATNGNDIWVAFGSSFVNPVVIASITTSRGLDTSVARVSDVTANGFNVRVQEADHLDGFHGIEDISWLVVEAGSWVLADGTMLQAGLTELSSTTRQGFASLAFETGFAADPAVLSQVQTDNDAAFVKTRMQGVDAAGFRVALEEEEAASWGGHGAETIGWIAVDKGLASDADGFAFEAGEIATNHNFARETFGGAFGAAPGVVAGTATFTASDPGGARMTDVTSTGFDIRGAEDRSLNAETSHGLESFNWVAFDGAGELWGDALV